LDRSVEILEAGDEPGGVGLGAVAGDRHEVDLAGDVDAAHQVGKEEHRALEDPDHDQLAALVVAAHLGAQLRYPAPQMLLGYEGLADRGVAHPPQSRYRGRASAPGSILLGVE